MDINAFPGKLFYYVYCALTNIWGSIKYLQQPENNL